MKSKQVSLKSFLGEIALTFFIGWTLVMLLQGVVWYKTGHWAPLYFGSFELSKILAWIFIGVYLGRVVLNVRNKVENKKYFSRLE